MSSSAIVEYLEDKYPDSGEPLWPPEVRARSIARRIAAEGDDYIYPNVRKLVVELMMRKDGKPDEAVIADAKAALTREISLFEGYHGPYVAGPEPSAADFSLYPFHAVLDRIATRRPEHEISDVMSSGVRRWMEQVEAVPYFSKTIPPHWKTS